MAVEVALGETGAWRAEEGGGGQGESPGIDYLVAMGVDYFYRLAFADEGCSAVSTCFSGRVGLWDSCAPSRSPFPTLIYHSIVIPSFITLIASPILLPILV